MLIGKTFWKGLALPKLLYATECIPFNQKELDKLQVIDNRAYRAILDVPIFTAAPFLRSEVGASSARSRDIKTKLLFIKHAYSENNNKILKSIICNEITKKETDWSKNVIKYMTELKLNPTRLTLLSKEQIKKEIFKWDSNLWKEQLSNKTTMTRYRSQKESIQETSWFRNGFKHSLMMRARADVLNLKWRNHGENNNSNDKTCSLCLQADETLDHFLLDCNNLQDIRNQHIILQRPANIDREEIINKLLLFNIENEQTEYYLQLLLQLWTSRTKLLKQE